MKYRFITIEGNIGAGKTSLAKALQNHLNARLILEAFADNPFLSKFYENPGQYAFPMELFFMAERYKQLKEFISSRDLFNTTTISDYLFTKCLLFARVTLPKDEYLLYHRLFNMINPQIIQPDLLIYLHVPVHKLQANIRKRNRSYEQKISNDYLLNIQDTYTQYIKQHNIKTLMVDAGNADFHNNPDHVQTIADALTIDYEDGQHSILLP